MQLFIFNHSAWGNPAKLELSGWSWPQLTTQTLPYRPGDTNCMFNLEKFLLEWPFHIFTILGDFYRISFDLTLLPREKKGGSRRLDLVFVRQSINVRLGLRTPSVNGNNGLNPGPSCQVKWDRREGPFPSIFTRVSLPLHASISFLFFSRFSQSWLFSSVLVSELAFFNSLLFSSAPIAYRHLARLLEPRPYPYLHLRSSIFDLKMCFMYYVHFFTN